MVGFKLSGLRAAAGLFALAGVTSVQAQSAVPVPFQCPATDNFPALLCKEDDGSAAPGNSQVILCYYSNSATNMPDTRPFMGRNGCPAGQIGSDGSTAALGPNGESMYYCLYNKIDGVLAQDNDLGSCPPQATTRQLRTRRRARSEAVSPVTGAQALRTRVDYFRALEASEGDKCNAVDTSLESIVDKIQVECYNKGF